MSDMPMRIHRDGFLWLSIETMMHGDRTAERRNGQFQRHEHFSDNYTTIEAIGVIIVKRRKRDGGTGA